MQDEPERSPCRGLLISTKAGEKLSQEQIQAHETLSGRRRGKSSTIAHIYNLRRDRLYRERRIHTDKTRPTKVSIGERRRPPPNGKPGYIRIDTCIGAILTVSRAFLD